MNRYELRPGMTVMHQDIPARVDKINPKNIIITHEDGRRWNAHPSYLSPAPEGTVFTLRVDAATGVTMGTVVKFKSTGKPGVFAVIGLQNGGTFKLAKLFGEDGNRYYHDVPATSIEVVDKAALKAYLIHTS